MAVKTVEAMLLDFSRAGLAISMAGVLRENTRHEDAWEHYCTVYPALLGRMWWAPSGKSTPLSYRVVTPTVRGVGPTLAEAMAMAFVLASADPQFAVYRRLATAFENCINAYDDQTRNSGRTSDGEAGEEDGVDGL